MTDKCATDGAARRSVPDWKRPAGPLNVWRVLEGEERLPGEPARPVRFSIQDIPESRYDEVVTHMCDCFLAEEVTCKSLSKRHAPFAPDRIIVLSPFLFFFFFRFHAVVNLDKGIGGDDYIDIVNLEAARRKDAWILLLELCSQPFRSFIVRVLN